MSSPPPGKPLLPNDAVDLVVEDAEASAEKMTRERRKGEPAVHGQSGDSRALRKVYRRGYKAQDKGGEEAAVEVEEERGPVEDEGEGTGVEDEQPKTTNIKVAKEGEDESERETRLLGDPETVEVTEMMVARAATPPLHARVDVDKYELADDDNPWL